MHIYVFTDFLSPETSGQVKETENWLSLPDPHLGGCCDGRRGTALTGKRITHSSSLKSRSLDGRSSNSSSRLSLRDSSNRSSLVEIKVNGYNFPQACEDDYNLADQSEEGIIEKIISFISRRKSDETEEEDCFTTSPIDIPKKERQLSVFNNNNSRSCPAGKSSPSYTQSPSRLLNPQYSHPASRESSRSNKTSRVSSAEDMTDTEKIMRHNQLVQAIRMKYNLGDDADPSTRRSNSSLDRYSPKSHELCEPCCRERSARSVGNIDQMRQYLLERGERVRLMDERAENLKIVTGALSKSTNALALKYKSKKWYE